MKIRTKLLLAIGTLPILFLLLLGTGLFQFQSFNNLILSLERTYETASLAHQIHEKVKEQSINVRNYVIFPNQANISAEISSLQSEIEHDILDLESLIVDDEQKQVFENLYQTILDFNQYLNHVILLSASGNYEKATQEIIDSGTQNQLIFYKTISEMIDDLETRMKKSLDELPKQYQSSMMFGSFISMIGVLFIIGFVIHTTWSIAKRVKQVSNTMINVANGDMDLKTRIATKTVDEIDDVAIAFNQMASTIEDQINYQQNQTWLNTNIADITTTLTSTQELKDLAQVFLSKTSPLVEACYASFYIKQQKEHSNESTFNLVSTYAGTLDEKSHSVRIGEGLVGQAALENKTIVLSNVPSDYFRLRSSVGEVLPTYVYVIPISYKDEITAVVEFASFQPFTNVQQALVEGICSNVGIILESLQSRIELAKLLEESQSLMEELQAQSEELQQQQEELRATNEELEEQTIALRRSEEKLQVQQLELEQTNEELKQKAESLALQNKRFEETNREIEKAKAELEHQAKQLALSSKYKSEFLANMSHELRTPLNSLLILSKLLAENHSENLTEKQIEYAKTIYSSGNDLLALINDILDLAKIESGKMDVHLSEVLIDDLIRYVEKNFRPIANENGLDFSIILHENVPKTIYSDEQRLQQVLKNLLANAFKFTLQGSVTLEVTVSEVEPTNITFAVIDTGIGIAEDKKELIFEAFQQADGTTSRRFAGTGLGLSICREIATLLGGQVQLVDSVEGIGSRFEFTLGDYKQEIDISTHIDILSTMNEAAATSNQTLELPPVEQNVNSMREEKLMVEDHIKRILIVEDDVRQRTSLMELIGDKDVVLSAASSGSEALELLKHNHFDCMILDLGLVDMNGIDLLEKIKSNPKYESLHVFIFTGKDISSKEEIQLKQYAHTIIIKDSHSPQRLLEELELCFQTHEEVTNVNRIERKDMENHRTDLEGKTILLVDDDVRNVFALTSALEMYGLNIMFAENGIEALTLLEKNADIDLVLMDIMMPEMDGYETIQRLRKIKRFEQLPVIALTAKAMKEDREKCIQAGASDYIAKPVDPNQLISLISVWLYSKQD